MLEPFYRAYEKLQKAWPRARDEVEERLSDPGLYSEYTKGLPEYMEIDGFLCGRGRSSLSLCPKSS